MIRVMTNYGDGEMINFSFDGFTIKLPEYYAKDVAGEPQDGHRRRFTLGEAPPGCRGPPSNLMLEVRWARPSGDGYIHGCLIKNTQRRATRAASTASLRDAIQRYVQAERRGSA